MPARDAMGWKQEKRLSGPPDA